MASYWFRNTGDQNWGTASNWSLTDGGLATGAVPTSSDDAFFSSNSGPCTINAVGRVCKTLIMAGIGAGDYASTLTATQSVTVSGDVKFSAGMTITGTAVLTINATSTITSGGQTWTGTLLLGGTSITYTLAADFTVATLAVSASGTPVLNGAFNLNVTGSWTSMTGQLQGTATVVFIGTGTFGSATAARINVTINTAGTFTINTTANFGGATFKYIAGTIVNTGSSMNFGVAGTTTTIDCSGMTFNNVLFIGSSGTITLLSDLNIAGTTQFGNGSGTLTGTGSFTLNCVGNIAMGSSGSFTSTSWTVNVTGNSTFTSSGQFAVLDFRINTGSNTFTHSQNGSVIGSPTVTHTITYVTGIINITSTSILSVAGSVVWNTEGIVWNQIDFSTADSSSATKTQTINSTLRVTGLIRIGGTGTAASSLTQTFAGSFGFICGSLAIQVINSGRTINFASGVSYFIRNMFMVSGLIGTPNIIIKASSAGVPSTLICDKNCDIMVMGVNITDINNGSGFPIYLMPNGVTLSTITTSGNFIVLPVNTKIPMPSNINQGLNQGLATGIY